MEILEQRFPILMEEYALHEGSGGVGQQRGGFGLKYKVRLRRGTARASFVMDHGRTGPQGAFGGQDGGVNKVVVARKGETYIPPHLSKDQDIRIEAGDSITVMTPGGGGYGDPFRRDPALVARDVSRGYYTAEQARAMFMVALDPAAGTIDQTATAQLRSARGLGRAAE